VSVRITLIGGSGQLGSDLRKRLRGEVVSLGSSDLDVRRDDDVAAALDRTRPDVVINCAAKTHVDRCEDEADHAFEVNALGAFHVACHSERLGASVVYVSTDYVYGAAGRRETPYCEDDVPGPINVYGASKLSGEYLTRAYCSRHFVVRSCGLYGVAGASGKGGNFVETILRLAGEGSPLRVVADQRLSPTSTWELAAKIAELIQTDRYGLYHVTARDHCTWYEFALEMVRKEGHDVSVEAIGTADYPTRARRPAMSALTSSELAAAGIESCRGWREMLHEYLLMRKSSTQTGSLGARNR